jgi:hypothetical protein
MFGSTKVSLLITPLTLMEKKEIVKILRIRNNLFMIIVVLNVPYKGKYIFSNYKG